MIFLRLLLDTHILFWCLMDDPRLTQQAKATIQDSSNTVFYSVVSLWEAEIKFLSHPGQTNASAERILTFCQESGYRLLPLKASHILTLKRLRLSDGAAPHKDPFDRMLISQAKAENLRFLTHDHRLTGYSEPFVYSV